MEKFDELYFLKKNFILLKSIFFDIGGQKICRWSRSVQIIHINFLHWKFALGDVALIVLLFQQFPRYFLRRNFHTLLYKASRELECPHVDFFAFSMLFFEQISWHFSIFFKAYFCFRDHITYQAKFCWLKSINYTQFFWREKFLEDFQRFCRNNVKLKTFAKKHFLNSSTLHEYLTVLETCLWTMQSLKNSSNSQKWSGKLCFNWENWVFGQVLSVWFSKIPA